MSTAQPSLTQPYQPARQGRGVPLLPIAVLAVTASAALYVLEVPTWAWAAPAALLGAIAASRYPAAAVVAVFAITGVIGTLTAFTALPVTKTVDFLLLCLWLGVAGTYVFGNPPRRPWLWPGLIAPGVYLAVSAFQILLADNLDLGFTSFRASTWYMSAAILVGIAPWPQGSLARLARGVAVAALLVGVYCTFRFLTGESAQEYAAARAAAPTLDDRFSGSMLSANQLSAWCGTTIPFCLALAVGWRGRWRLVALGAVGSLAIVLLATDVRGGVAAAVVGVLLTLLLHQLAPVFPGRLGVGLLVTALVASVSIGAFVVAAEGTGRADRLESLLDPADDVTYSERLKRWDLAVDVIGENPLGLGLGTVGQVAVVKNPAGSAVDPNLDSSYLKIGLEQGVVVMGLFIFGLFALLVGTAVRALRSVTPETASLAIGGCGSLAALLVLFYSGLYIEGMPIVSGWLLVGLGVAAVTVRDVERREPLERVHSP